MTPSGKIKERLRIDQILQLQGLASSRERAQALVLAGQVLVDDHRVEKPSQRFIPETVTIRLKGKDHPFVSRGGVKLAEALREFEIRPSGKICLDIGASTGGFTDCLLQKGAKRVLTLDSGTNQLHYRLRTDPRVSWKENFNARYLKPGDIAEPVDLVVMDVSFISLKKMIPPLLKAVPGPWELLFLVKPQFEAGPEKIEKGGILRDEKLRKDILEDMIRFTGNLGLSVQGSCPAAIKGEKGNQEYFIYARRVA